MRALLRVVVVGAFVLALSKLSFAQTNITLNGVGGHLGYVMPEDPIENTIGFGAQADLGTITESICLAAFLDFWSKSYDAGSMYGEAEWSWTEIVIGASAKYFFPSQSQFKPYAGGGLNFTIGRSKWEYTDYLGHKYEDSDSDTDIGAHIFGGVEYLLSPNLNGYAELKYHTDGADYFGIFAGVTYLLAK